jgi:hypothetical protein
MPSILIDIILSFVLCIALSALLWTFAKQNQAHPPDPPG